jgi:hypothetical protein
MNGSTGVGLRPFSLGSSRPDPLSRQRDGALGTALDGDAVDGDVLDGGMLDATFDTVQVRHHADLRPKRLCNRLRSSANEQWVRYWN